MHIILEVKDAIERFDPLADLLVSEGKFLTWRRHDQYLPNSESTRIFCLVSPGRWQVSGRFSLAGWFLTPIGLDLDIDGVEIIHAWLDRTAVDAENGRLGVYRHSQFAGLLGTLEVPRDMKASPAQLRYNLRTRFLSGLTKQVRLPRPFEFEPRPNDPEAEWERLRKEILGQLLELNLTAA